MAALDLADLRTSYERDGVVRVPGAFDAHWVATLVDAFDRLMARVKAGEKLAPDSALGPEHGRPDGDFDARTGRGHLRYAAVHDAALARWLRESPAAALVGELTGSTRVQFWYDLWFCKEPAPADGATPWHHDATGHPFTGSAIPSLWIALTDVGPDDAPLLTFRGSHRDPRLFRPPYAPGREHLELPANFAPLEAMLAQVEREAERVQTWTCRAGDCLLLHPLTWHASRPQRNTASRRLACTSRWVGDDLAWQPGPFSFDGYHRAASALAPGARPPYPFLPVLWERGSAGAARTG